MRQSNQSGAISGYSRRSIVGVSVSIVALSAAASAHAQSVPATAPQTAQAEQSGGLEDIVVTAQRRNELQQDVPIAISTVTAAAASRQGVTGTETLGIAVPALQFSRQSSNGGTPFLRGVGSSQGAAGAESPVALYIDDVYVGSASATQLQFNNVVSTEVLKGPQGTLFGRNATGGVVHIHTKLPSQQTAMDATVGFSSYDTYSGSLYATTGLGDKAAINIAMTGQNQTKGYGYNAHTGNDIYKGWNYGFRSQLKLDAADTTSILLSADYSKAKTDRGLNFVIFPGTIALGGSTHQGDYIATSDPDDYSITEVYGFSAKLDQDVGDLKLVSISAYRHSSQKNQIDNDGSLPGAPKLAQINAFPYQDAFSQEIQLQSAQSDKFQWILGGFYYHTVSAYNPLVFSGTTYAALGGASITQDKQILNSYAGFGEASYEFLPRTKLTAGLRYTSDHFSNNVLLTTATGAVRAPSPFSQRDNFSKLTYRAILDHKINDAIMLYGSYSRGFKSGGYVLAGPTITVGGVVVPAPAVAPEVLDAFEGGFKSELFGRILRLNVSAFHYTYNNMQVTSIQGGASVTLNAAKAKIKGIDVDWNFVPSRRLNIGGGFSLLDSKFDSFPSGPLYVPNPANCATRTTTGPLTGGNTVCNADLSGNTTPRAPTFSMSLTGTYTLPTDVGDFALNASLYHNSGFFWEVDNRRRQPKYDLLNATASWTSSDGKYEVRFFARNLLNEYYYSYFSETNGRDSGSPEMPRNYGGSLSVHF